jgi:hypothetical protein
MHNLTQHTKRVRMKPDGTNYNAAAGSSAATSDALDTLGFQSVLLRVGFGEITAGAVTSIKAQQSADSSGSPDGFSDLAGTSQAVADDDDYQVFEIEIHRPAKRYLKVVTSRATQNAVVDYIDAILYNPVHAPATAHATTGGTETFNSPAEGTA